MTASRSRLCQRATFALIAFIGATLVAMLSPVLHAGTFEQVCSARGSKSVLGADTRGGHDPAPADHAAHCPLCMPLAAPPAENVRSFTPVLVQSPERAWMPTARVATLAGAALPARGPPSVS